VNHGVLSWACGCESCCVMLSQWLWISMCYSVAVAVNHGVLFWASGCELCCVILSQWIWIMVSYAEPVVVNHGVLCWACGCESWWALTLDYMTKTLNQIIFFPPPKSEYFFQQHWESQYFFRKKTYPPLQVKWSIPYSLAWGRSVVLSWHSWHQQ
jgi:hypothetical protein